MDKTLRGLENPPSWSIEGLLSCEADEDPSTLTDRSQPMSHIIESGHMYENLISYKEDVPSVRSEAGVAFYSSTTGKRVGADGRLDSAYWLKTLENMVLFQPSVQALLEDFQESMLLVEIGPHSSLGGYAKQLIRDRPDGTASYIPTLRRNSNSFLDLLKTIGRIYGHGGFVDFSGIHHKSRVLTDIPTYPWDEVMEMSLPNRIEQAFKIQTQQAPTPRIARFSLSEKQ
ncbi:hypothetical protein HIM_05848 [Hirsutella minnesotensis 3608]|uniref:Malonyl-CoA:ACP transacylase (MAT) domain-containing protein n=1 Tax=Hirsutella minnesotensis 3608 TaxID=1043627 RepID=A0A0F7ZJW2_9HYPO|nr:hypothetical protein HIM_05848 [Hirsutella minnesotensis 3608]